MKKILSFVLVLAMVLASVSMAFAAEVTYPDVQDTDEYAPAVKALTALGVVEGYNDGTFKPEKTITRAEAIKIVVAALGLPVTEGNSYPTQFTDVPATAWYSGYVRYGVALGITEGTSKEHFSPDATVTYDQVITFIMRALGYSDKLVGGYPTGYIMQAYQLGILEAGDETGNAGAPRGDIAQYLYKALDEPFVFYSKDTDSFQAYDNITHKPSDGCLNMYARLGATPDTTATGDPAFTLVDAAVMENATVDLSEYFGANVQLVKNAKGVVVGIGEVETTFLTGAKTSSGTTTIAGKSLASDVDQTTVAVFNNGEAAGVESPATVGASDIYAVKLNSADKVAKIVSRQTWTVNGYEKYDPDADTINLKDEDGTGVHTLQGFDFPLNDDKTINTGKFILEGVKSLGDIAKGNVIYVYNGPVSNKITKVAVGTEEIEGTVTKISSDNKTFTVGGTDYKLSAGAAATLAGDLATWMNGGNTIKAQLGPDGKIFSASQVTSSTSTIYGILLKSEVKGGGITATAAKAQIFTQNGETIIYDMVSALNGSATHQIVGGTAAANQGDLVKLEINDKGQIKDVKDAVALGGATAIGDKGLVGGAFIDDATVVFAYDTTAAIDKADSYSVIAGKSIYSQNLPIGTIAGSSATKIAAAIVDGTGIVNKDANYVIFTGYAQVTDGDEITVWGKDGKATYIGDNTEYAVPTTGGASAYTLKFNSDDVASVDTTKASTFNASPVGTITVNGSQAVIDGAAKEVESDIVIYTKTSSGWSVSTGSAKLTAAKGASLSLISTDTDAAFEIAVIIK